MDKESIFDEPLIRLSFVIIGMIVVIAIVATNAVYFGEQLPVAQLPKAVPQDIEIQVVYEGDWGGTYSDVGRTMSISGTGAKTISFPDAKESISASVEKQDDSERTLTVRIVRNDVVVAEETTNEAYGVAAVAYNLA
jgi:hypothetical protein